MSGCFKSRVLLPALLLCLLMGFASAADTIRLGEKEVPADKFHVFVVFGDSNTFGSGNQKEEWSSPRAWRMNGKGQWEQATNSFPMFPGEGSEPRSSSVGWWVLRYLTEYYPDHHFGLLQYCNTSSGEGMSTGEIVGRTYEPMIAFLEPYVGQFHFIGVVMEGQVGNGKNFDKMRGWFREDLGVESVPVVICGWRLGNYNFWPGNAQDARATEDIFGKIWNEIPERGIRFQGRDAVINACELSKTREDMRLIFPFNIAMQDNRHMYGRSLFGQGGHEVYNKNFLYALVANGWAINDGKTDKEAPSVPSNLRSENTWHEGATLYWEPARDNLAVYGYEVFANGKKVPWWPTLPEDINMVTTGLTSFPLSGLQPDTDYEIKVRAVDYANNFSAFSEPITIHTSSEKATLDVPIHVNIGGPAAGKWLADKPWREGGGYGYVLSPGAHMKEQNQRFVNRTQPIAEAFVENAPERTVFGWFRRAPNVYRFDVENGTYRVTWYMRVTHYKLKRKAEQEMSRSYAKEDVPDTHSFRNYPPDSALGKLLNQEAPYGDVGRAVYRTYEVTDNVLIANPLDQQSIGHSGQEIYAVIVEKVDAE